jgi:hypothetical protein
MMRPFSSRNPLETLMARKRRSGTAGWGTVLEVQAAMWTVLGVRVPQILTGRMTPAEQTRMIAEKVDAFAQSQHAAAEALGRMALRPPARTPGGLASSAASIAAAAFRPYHRKVTANAKRLTRVRKT